MSVGNTPVLDIMVPTHGKLDMTIRCINALYDGTSHPFHLIVVDDSESSKPGSSADKPVEPWDTTKAYMEGFVKAHKNVTYIHSDIPYTSGNQFFNIAIKPHAE